MQQCSNCGHQNRAGVVFCENCGASLIGRMPLDTKSLDAGNGDENSKSYVDAQVRDEMPVQGIVVFEQGTLLRLDIEGSTDPVIFKPKTETIFGRRDPATGALPDVDLAPFAGYRMGVSRRHAAIRISDDQTLGVWDLGSSNGTFLNGQRLNAHRPYNLRDGDELRLGQMIIRVYFQPPKKAVLSPEDTATRRIPEMEIAPAAEKEAAPAPVAADESAVAALAAAAFETPPKEKPTEAAPAPAAPATEAAMPAGAQDEAPISKSDEAAEAAPTEKQPVPAPEKESPETAQESVPAQAAKPVQGEVQKAEPPAEEQPVAERDSESAVAEAAPAVESSKAEEAPETEEKITSEESKENEKRD
jgi:pSer/pThr/pTyr-binding forkhead associated (FHA) protein